MSAGDPRYFEVDDDMTSDRWLLDTPVGPGDEWLGTAFTRAQPYGGATPLTSRVYYQGPGLPPSLTGPYPS